MSAGSGNTGRSAGAKEWRISGSWDFSKMAGSVDVRVRRDADEQLGARSRDREKLSAVVATLTVQLVKDADLHALGGSLAAARRNSSGHGHLPRSRRSSWDTSPRCPWGRPPRNIPMITMITVHGHSHDHGGHGHSHDDHGVYHH